MFFNANNQTEKENNRSLKGHIEHPVTDKKPLLKKNRKLKNVFFTKQTKTTCFAKSVIRRLLNLLKIGTRSKTIVNVITMVSLT